jgi:predicted glycoside hydrolase/deacetylase ChbG (UPF0249 family)
MAQEKKVTLCADDFGISPSISESICRLAEMKRISATSVMVVYKEGDLYHKSLLGYTAHLDIGLHFVLTDATPISLSREIKSITDKDGNFVKMSQFIKRAWLGCIDGDEVLVELTAQYKKFIDNFGVEPNFIDGHHNVHQYPVVGDAVIKFVKNKNLGKKIYLRNTAHRWDVIFKGKDLLKTAFISAPGLIFKKKLLANELRTNESFGGVYNLNNPGNFKKRIEEFLVLANAENSIIMVHPGRVDTILAQRDSFCKGREIEEHVLLQKYFPEFLDANNLTLSKFE